MSSFFFFNDTATTEIYTLSLHDALPICAGGDLNMLVKASEPWPVHNRFRHANTLFPPLLTLDRRGGNSVLDRKSTRLNSSHTVISYAVFCLKKKNALVATREAAVVLMYI